MRQKLPNFRSISIHCISKNKLSVQLNLQTRKTSPFGFYLLLSLIVCCIHKSGIPWEICCSSRIRKLWMAITSEWLSHPYLCFQTSVQSASIHTLPLIKVFNTFCCQLVAFKTVFLCVPPLRHLRIPNFFQSVCIHTIPLIKACSTFCCWIPTLRHLRIPNFFQSVNTHTTLLISDDHLCWPS